MWHEVTCGSDLIAVRSTLQEAMEVAKRESLAHRGVYVVTTISGYRAPLTVAVQGGSEVVAVAKYGRGF